jgi:quinol-cytochrome oxidoreductase complex cytochrome b subunit
LLCLNRKYFNDSGRSAFFSGLPVGGLIGVIILCLLLYAYVFFAVNFVIFNYVSMCYRLYLAGLVVRMAGVVPRWPFA